mmetsp:Transcript_11232/g.27467  ORF Transcript_11232/g.27467 Transcript_11232/m.27467 type:complete len:230 (+) Transcript_11232:321-1010(+)|eukprot:CAMPEP_0178991550 /NCGR_PEP_ID=MMETSP0795-20121207/5595_1 /TAXON_ID=88552 /ORGANISM="Amoebophrya sp., Strain Ameob2" /LENGTH=229 /DNA_ID=CAMNT_0020683281 /DNA_START=319 /DNA_END=1008 /DNA_ORIENTATION=-
MVLPVPGIEFLDDAVIPEPARRFFTWLRYALITEIVFAIFRLCLGDIAGSISDFICILFGVFFMRSDEVIGSMYRYLRNTMIAMCCGGGGFRVLMPFCFLSGLNGVFNLLIFVQFPILVPYTVVTSLLGIIEIFCAYCGWQIYKNVSAYQMGSAGYGPRAPAERTNNRAAAPGAAGGGFGGGMLGGGGGQGAQGGSGGGQAGEGLFGATNNAQAQQFQVFQGQGRRLGD